MMPSVTLEMFPSHRAIALIVADNPPVNAMSPGFPRRIIEGLDEAKNNGFEAIVLSAGGRGGFSGADIKLQGRSWPENEAKMSDLIAHLEAFALPVAILVKSFALGGGLEIALACRWRIGTPAAQFGQPEVKLGIPPGAGGTQRLPRLIGVEGALDLILNGEPISASAALEAGLIDRIVEADRAIEAAMDFVAESIRDGSVPEPASSRTVSAPEEVFEAARKKAARRQRGQRAPQACIEAIEGATKLPFKEGLALERKLYEECVSSDQAAAMRHVFFAQRMALKVPGLDQSAPRPHIVKVAVIGAGTMGAGISLALAASGFSVLLIDKDDVGLSRGMTRIERTLDSQSDRGRITAEERDRRKQNVSYSIDTSDISMADAVIEAVFEDLELKKSVFRQNSELASPTALLATNTSYLDVDEIAAATGNAGDRVLGLHFFSPANVMPLLEIVKGRRTSDSVLSSGVDFCRRLGKTGVVSGVCHGFIANRMFEKYLREAEFLLAEGATPEQVDTALVAFGMPMGPFAVRDLAGLDIGWAKRKATAHLRDPSKRYSVIGDRLCERGWFGQKTGRGFYLYGEEGTRPSANPEIASIILEDADLSGIAPRKIENEEIIRRCLYAIINEGAKILEEGIALRASDIDLVWINGYGFPAWRGGPMFWADSLGLDAVLEQINSFNSNHNFWEPALLLQKLVTEDRQFSDLDRGALYENA